MVKDVASKIITMVTECPSQSVQLLVGLLLSRDAGEDEYLDAEHIVDCFFAQENSNKMEWVKKIMQLPDHKQVEVFESLQINDVADASKIVRVAAARYDNAQEIQKIEDEKKDLAENGAKGSSRRRTTLRKTRRETGLVDGEKLRKLTQTSLPNVKEDDPRY
jgi:hypothetical protein